MQKGLPITIILLLITTIATPVLAAPNEKAADKAHQVVSENKHEDQKSESDNNNPAEGNNGQEKEDGKKQEVLKAQDITTPTPQELTVKAHKKASITPSVTCDPSAPWKNHGQYVSCVAHQKLGGKAVSNAAHSDIGKKKQVSVTPSVSPSASPTATPTETITPTPPITSAEEALTLNRSFLTDNILAKNLKHLGQLIKDFIQNLV